MSSPYLCATNNSMVITKADIKIKFNMLPIPRYFKIKKIINATVDKTPLLVFAKIVDEVKKDVKKTRNKNNGIAPI